MKKQILVVLLLVGIFILTPVFTYAQTRDQLINQLRQLIIQLQAQLKVLQVPTLSGTDSFTHQTLINAKRSIDTQTTVMP